MKCSKCLQSIFTGEGGDRPDSYFNADELKKGIEIELEHVDDKGIAKQIAKDHLMENPLYYTHLIQMEEKYAK